MKFEYHFTRMMGCATFVVCLLTFCTVAVAQESFLWKTDDEGGWLGVSIQDMTTGLKEALDYDREAGVLVNDVEENSPAEEAGIKEGDIIIEFDGKAVSNTGSLIRKVRASDPGDEVDMVIVRKGREKRFTVTIGDVPKKKSVLDVRKGKKDPSVLKITEETPGWLGVHLHDLNDQLGEYFGVSDGAGALITEVLEESPAERAGLQAGDVVVAYEGKDIDDVAELKEAVLETEVGREVGITVVREKRSRIIHVEIGEAPQKYPSELYGIPAPEEHWDIRRFDKEVFPWRIYEEKMGKDKLWRMRVPDDREEDELRDLKIRLEKLEREIERLKDRF